MSGKHVNFDFSVNNVSPEWGAETESTSTRRRIIRPSLTQDNHTTTLYIQYLCELPALVNIENKGLPQRVTISPFLKPRERASRSHRFPVSQQPAQFDYDLTYPLHFVTYSQNHLDSGRAMRTVVEYDDAFDPGLSKITIHLPHLPRHSFSIEKELGDLTVADVLFGIHMGLRDKISESDCQDAWKDWDLVSQVSSRRINSILDVDHREGELKRGNIVLDMFNGKKYFRGLNLCAADGPDVWELVIE